jgi:DNA replicative helicase MCM subunit Mcm2 (Cdc46/Mcm family)
MKNVKYHCESCDSQFSVNYNEMECEDSPRFCAFCGEYLIDDDIEIEDE